MTSLAIPFIQHTAIYTSVKSFNLMNMDVGMHHAKNRGNKEIPLAILLAQSCVTLCLKRVTVLVSLIVLLRGFPCFHDFSQGASLHPYSFIFTLVPHIFRGSRSYIRVRVRINAATRICAHAYMLEEVGHGRPTGHNATLRNVKTIFADAAIYPPLKLTHLTISLAARPRHPSLLHIP